MSQNVLGMYHKGARKNWESRIDEVSGIITANNVEIITLQEARPLQTKRLMQRLGKNYEIYPARFIKTNKLSHRSILYQATDRNGKPLWQLKESGKLAVPGYSDKKITQHTTAMPWGRFVNAQTHQQVIVLSIHAVAYDKKRDGLDKGGALKREKTGHYLAAWARDMKNRYPGVTIVIAGDINQTDKLRRKDKALKGNRNRIIPCILGQELRAIDDLAANKPGVCPESNAGIDQMFTNSTDVKNIRSINKGQSDHPALLADIQLP